VTRTIACIQHDPSDGPGLIAAWCRARGHELRVVQPSDPLPEGPSGIDLVILLGGAASALDGSSRQRAERAFARVTFEAGKPVLGLCLGAQMLAVELGGDVLPGAAPEHDWSRLRVEDAWLSQALGATDPVVFQAHADAIRLPPGAQQLATNLASVVEAFRGPGPVLGLQFHLEADKEKVEAFRASSGAPPRAEGDEDRIARCRQGLERLLDDWLDGCA
jgi:GMP synthase (glutamine-hydrolysing)